MINLNCNKHLDWGCANDPAYNLLTDHLRYSAMDSSGDFAAESVMDFVCESIRCFVEHSVWISLWGSTPNGVVWIIMDRQPK